jgi:hypothetical protein
VSTPGLPGITTIKVSGLDNFDPKNHLLSTKELRGSFLTSCLQLFLKICLRLSEADFNFSFSFFVIPLIINTETDE